MVGGAGARTTSPSDWFGPKEVRQLDRFAQFSMAAADMAVSRRRRPRRPTRPRRASIFATGVGGFETLAEQVGVYNEKGPDRVSPRLVPMMMANAGAAGISMRLAGAVRPKSSDRLRGGHPRHRRRRRGWWPRAVAMSAIGGGAEASMHPVAVAAFANMTALSTSGHSRPFDARRDGFVMTEGAAALVLEDWDRAVARGATIYAEVAGAASTADAHHITAPAPDGAGAVACMELALGDAGIGPPTSGTSTPTGPRPPSTTWPRHGPSPRSSASPARSSPPPRG